MYFSPSSFCTFWPRKGRNKQIQIDSSRWCIWASEVPYFFIIWLHFEILIVSRIFKNNGPWSDLIFKNLLWHKMKKWFKKQFYSVSKLLPHAPGKGKSGNRDVRLFEEVWIFGSIKLKVISATACKEKDRLSWFG